MKKYLITISSFLLPLVALANGAHEEGPETVGQQWFAVVLCVVLWASLIYTVYTLIQKFSKTSQLE